MCEQREQVLEYLYDEASPTGRREVERHLESCDECRDELRAFRNVREDLLAWGVPNPPSVWTAFAPPPVVPWHKQVPAWAMAAAASLMFVLGTAGGFVAHSVVDGSSPGATGSVNATVVPPEITQASLLDSKAIVALIREELGNAGREDSTGRVTPVGNTPARPFQLDPRTEERLMGRVSELVNENQQRQQLQVFNYLWSVAQEEGVRRKDTEIRFGQLKAQMDQLQAAVNQLVLAQMKGQ
jgi:anti-sigma factor RsiW